MSSFLPLLLGAEDFEVVRPLPSLPGWLVARPWAACFSGRTRAPRLGVYRERGPDSRRFRLDRLWCLEWRILRCAAFPRPGACVFGLTRCPPWFANWSSLRSRGCSARVGARLFPFEGATRARRYPWRGYRARAGLRRGNSSIAEPPARGSLGWSTKYSF